MKYGRNDLHEPRPHHGGGHRKQAICWGATLLLLLLVIPAWAQGPWTISVVDGGHGEDVGKTSSLVIDKQGDFHVVYYDDTAHALFYSYRARGAKKWFNMKVIPKGIAGYPSMAVDDNGRPHIAYVTAAKRDTQEGLGYSYFDGKTWHSQMIDPQGVGYFTSLQLDSKGNPRISYYHYHDRSGAYSLHLKYAYFDGKDWYIQTVDQRMSTGKYNALAVDTDGNPHIAYTHVGWGDLLYAYWNGKEWKFSDVDSRRKENHYVGMGPSIVVDTAGNAHIAYFDITKAAVKYAWFENGTWKTEVADEIGAHGELDRVSLKLDSHNQPHLAYYDAGAGMLKYAVRDDKGWHTEVVDHDGNVGQTPSLSLTADGAAYITYYDAGNQALRFAARAAGAPLPAVTPAVAESKGKSGTSPKTAEAAPPAPEKQ